MRIALSMVLTLASANCAAQLLQSRTIALGGVAVSGDVPGTTIGFFTQGPQINPAGDVGFECTLNVPGIFFQANAFVIETGSGPFVLVRDGGPVPGLPGEVFDFFNRPALLLDGSAGFTGFLRNVTSPMNQVLFSPVGQSSSIMPLILGGSSSSLPGLNFSMLSVAGFSPYGDVSFQSRLSGAGITTDNDDSVWAYDRLKDRVFLYAREDAPVGNNTDLIIDGVRPLPRPGIGPVVVAPFQLEIGDAVGFNESFVLTDAIPGEMPPGIFLRTGQAVPGNPLLSFDGQAGAITGLVTNGWGDSAFLADIVGEGVEFGLTDNAVFSRFNVQPPELKLRRGSPVPGTDEIFSTLRSVQINNNGDLLVYADVRPLNNFTGTTVYVLLPVDGGMRVVFRERQTIPAFGNLELTSSEVAFNSAGDVAILATTRNPTTAVVEGETLLISRASDPRLVPVVSSGDQILVDGQLRTVDARFAIGFASTSTERPYSGLGDNGEIVARISFTDGTQMLQASRFRPQNDCFPDDAEDFFDVIAALREVDRLRSLGFVINPDRDGDGVIELEDLLVCPNQLLPTPAIAP